jgi:hypothetical protein
LAAKAAMKGTAFRPYFINKAERVLTPACPGEPWEVRFFFICLRIKVLGMHSDAVDLVRRDRAGAGRIPVLQRDFEAGGGLVVHKYAREYR